MTEKATKTLEILKGKLIHNEQKIGSNDKPYWVLEIEGHGKVTIPAWKSKVAEGLTVGKIYEYAVEKDDKFTNIVSSKEVAQEAPKQATPPPEHKETYIPQPKDNTAIMAQVALKSAVERANGIGGIGGREVSTAEIISMGQEFMVAMKAWSMGKMVSPIAKPVATAPVGVKIVDTIAEPPKAPPEGKQGAKASKISLDRIDQLSRALTAAGYLPGEVREALFKGMKISKLADLDTSQGNLLDAWCKRKQVENEAKAQAQGKIMPADSGDPFL